MDTSRRCNWAGWHISYRHALGGVAVLGDYREHFVGFRGTFCSHCWLAVCDILFFPSRVTNGLYLCNFGLGLGHGNYINTGRKKYSRSTVDSDVSKERNVGYQGPLILSVSIFL
jgi:hypothetical protein